MFFHDFTVESAGNVPMVVLAQSDSTWTSTLLILSCVYRVGLRTVESLRCDDDDDDDEDKDEDEHEDE